VGDGESSDTWRAREHKQGGLVPTSGGQCGRFNNGRHGLAAVSTGGAACPHSGVVGVGGRRERVG
jgi:hypothetical protein